MRRTLALALLALLVSAGCIYREPGPTEVQGKAQGYSPTPAFLKVDVRTEDDRTVVVAFDRRDWHVAELARRLDQRQVSEVVIAATERNIPGEVVADTFRSPGELNDLRYAAMGMSDEDRLRLDREYDALLAELSGTAPAAPTPLRVL